VGEREQVSDPTQQKSKFTSEQHHSRGIALLEAGYGSEAFEQLSRAYLIDPQNARFRSSYALALALVRGEFLGAAELAGTAVRQEFSNPDLYQNLARIYLAFDFKADAIRFLRRALMLDPENATIQLRLAELGIRRRPLIRFLSRGNALNRLLGRVQARILGRMEWALSRVQGA
jgi:Flp pilus assembly protein TadD